MAIFTRFLIILLLFVSSAQLFAQNNATIIEVQTGKYIGFVSTPNGVIFLNQVTVTKLSVDPQPGPSPPFPQPTDNPFGSAPGLKVLIIEEQEARHTLPKPQRDILTLLSIRQFLDQHCTKDSAGNSEWRILDKDTPFASENQWKKAMAVFQNTQPRTSDFWIIISNGRQWTSQALPANEADMLALLRKYAGMQASEIIPVPQEKILKQSLILHGIGQLAA